GTSGGGSGVDHNGSLPGNGSSSGGGSTGGGGGATDDLPGTGGGGGGSNPVDDVVKGVGDAVGGIVGGGSGGGGGGASTPTPTPTPKPAPAPDPPKIISYADAKAQCIAQGIKEIEVAKLAACILNKRS
ncbi:MAG: hypothetical protein JWR85_1471, partial [Marmoricola sp.]|nr:hypothetical protein [Marmoricola sp.]